MAGIYIHIPFCKQKCHYCNFFSVASEKNKDQFIIALLKEIALQKDYLDGEEVETIYFGGGTPSILSVDEIRMVLDEISKFHQIGTGTEITLEANPDDLDKKKVFELRKTPVNRLSIGVQSFFKEDHKYLNRIHTGYQASLSISYAKEVGFDNISIDLIYGIPTLTKEKWLANLNKFFSFNLQHLSAYALTVEPKTALEILINKGKMKPVNENSIVGHFKQLITLMNKQGFFHYEISNFCREGFYSKHNKSYWVGKKYLGLGPSAHSFNGKSRQWNVSNISKYISEIEMKKIPAEKENLTTIQKYNEYILTSMRTIWGIDSNYIKKHFGEEFLSYFEFHIKEYIKSGKVIRKQDKFFLSDNGKLFADGIASGLFR